MDFLTKFAWVLENGTLQVKLLVSFILSVLLSPFLFIYEKLRELGVFNFLIPDGDFAVIMFWCLIIDLVTGMGKWWKRSKFDFGAMTVGFATKVAITYLGMLLFEGLGNIEELKEHTDIRSYLVLIGKLTVFFYVAGSAFNNLYYLSDGKFPPIGWMKRMKAFEESADTKVFTNDKDSSGPVESQDVSDTPESSGNSD